MADTNKNYLDKEGLKIVIQKLEGYADEAAASASDGAFKYVGYADNALKFYAKNPIEEGDVPAFTIDLPAEQVIDQTRTTFVQEFAWSDKAYPGSTNPSTAENSIEGKPVLVLAVKTVGDTDDSFTYSFLAMDKVVTLYKGGETDTAKVTVDADSNILVDVKISEADGNLLRIVEDADGNKGLYASSPAADLSKKANKLVDPETIDETHPAVIKAGQILVDDGSGDMAGSGVTISDIEKKITDVSDTMGDVSNLPTDAEGNPLGDNLVDAMKNYTDKKIEDVVGIIPTEADPESGQQVPVADTVIEYIDQKTQAIENNMVAITPEEIEAMFAAEPEVTA